MNFTDLNISLPLLNALTDLKISTPTGIQEKVFSVIMSGRDMVGIAQTGTGKTLAYLLPCLRQWTFTKEKSPSIVVVVPTRELVLQVVDVVKNLAKYTNIRTAGVFGGVNMIQQSPAIAAGCDVLVATPGRLLDFVLNGTLKLRAVKKFIIDEVDEMLALGFRPQLTRIIDLLPSKRQNLMFSATITDDIREFVNDFFVNPVQVEAARSGEPLAKIKQAGIAVPNFYTKINLLKFLLAADKNFAKVLLFVSTKKTADRVFELLSENFGKQIGIIHSNKSQNFRLTGYKNFNENKIKLLIATDIAARGLDFDDVSHVVNFDLPDDTESYIHRIGRTGRAEKLGVAISLITKNDNKKIADIEQFMKKKIPMMLLPAQVDVSDELLPEEKPKTAVKIIRTKTSVNQSGGAFKMKKEKNQKINQKITRSEQMRLKYGKPKTRGQKNK